VVEEERSISAQVPSPAVGSDEDYGQTNTGKENANEGKNKFFAQA